MKRRRMAQTLLFAASAFVLSSCTGGSAGNPAPKPGKLVSQQAQEQGKKQPVISLGDLNGIAGAKKVGAPFDPCSTVTWKDFPKKTRGGDPPSLQPKSSKDAYSVACRWSSDTITSVVMWGNASTLKFAPKGAAKEPVKFATATGYHKTGKADAEKPTTCHSRMKLEKGVAAMTTDVDGGKKIDPCKVNTSVLTAIAKRTP